GRAGSRTRRTAPLRSRSIALARLLRIGALGVACLALLALTHTLLTGTSRAQAPQATRIWAGVFLHDVTSFDQRRGVFDVDADVWVKWRGEFDPELVQIANAVRIDRVSLGRDSDGSWHSARWRVRGTLRGEFPLEGFPFDDQTLGIVLELPEHHGVLAPDLAASGMAESFSITDWLYEPEFHPVASTVTYPSDLGHIENEGRAARTSRVEYRVTLSRP